MYKPNEAGSSTSSDRDVCYLTLKWLTYEVAQRTSNINEQSALLTSSTERDLKQLETYTIQFQHVQHEMSIQIQEMSKLKDETESISVFVYNEDAVCLVVSLHLSCTQQCNSPKLHFLPLAILLHISPLFCTLLYLQASFEVSHPRNVPI